jgi:twitching motility two-component system response regulator PilH
MADPRKRLLIIDDDIDFVDLLTKMLAKSAISVHACHYGEQGLEEARKLKPDLIVLDVMMPGIHGLTALGQLRSWPETAHTAVLVATTLPREEIEVGAAKEDAEYLNKSESIQNVANRIKRRLGLPD